MASPTKPAKPKGFALTPNGNGQWSKKINGKIYCFGKWTNPDGAMESYLEAAHNMVDMKPARSDKSVGLTVRDRANEFLTFKQHKMDTGELAPRTFSEYRDTCERLIRVLGRDLFLERIQAGELLKVRESISKRKLPKSAEHTPTVFITKRGESWYKPESRANPLSAGIWGFPFGPPAADLKESTAQRTADGDLTCREPRTARGKRQNRR